MSKFLMTAQEALLKIKAMFAEAAQAPEAPAVASFAEYVLASGAKVMIDKLELGGKVSLVDELGNEAPAPAGEHMLADGTKIVLDETATIVEIEAPEVEVPEVETPETPSEIELMKKKVEEMEAQIEDLKKDKKGMEVKMSENADKFSKAITELTDVVIELSKAPSAQPQTPKEAFNKHIESKNDKVSRFLNMYAKK